VTDLTIRTIRNLEGGAVFGNSLFGLMQNMPQWHQLACYDNPLRAEGVRAFQPALRANRALKQLSLCGCSLWDDGTRLIADALAGNTTMDLI
jgi:hypothetical protein